MPAGGFYKLVFCLAVIAERVSQQQPRTMEAPPRLVTPDRLEDTLGERLGVLKARGIRPQLILEWPFAQRRRDHDQAVEDGGIAQRRVGCRDRADSDAAHRQPR